MSILCLLALDMSLFSVNIHISLHFISKGGYDHCDGHPNAQHFNVNRSVLHRPDLMMSNICSYTLCEYIPVATQDK